jgi:Ni,Fe-hydrogenase III small subunit
MTYGFDAEHLMVWIDAFDAVAAGRDGVLCRRHADAMVVPLGWMLDDRREPVPRLFKTPPKPATAVVRTRRSSSRHRDDTEQLELVVEARTVGTIDADIAAVDDDKPVDVEVLPWKPMFDTSDDLGGLLEARSPLLARAFGGKERRSPSR